MILKGEDLYYFAYNILVLLSELGAKDEGSKFVDCEKIPFLIEFVSDARMCGSVYRARNFGLPLSGPDQQRLHSVYTTGLLHRHTISRLFFAMERKGVVSLVQDPLNKTICVWLNSQKLPAGYFSEGDYNAEIENIKTLKKIAPRVKTMVKNTMLSRLFDDSGVLTWRV
jgi:hypothetical protein